MEPAGWPHHLSSAGYRGLASLVPLVAALLARSLDFRPIDVRGETFFLSMKEMRDAL
jgi:hypothetical protein